MRRLLRPADSGGDLDAARDHAHVPRAERAHVVRERARRAHDGPRPPHERPEEPGRAPRELDVRPPRLQHEGLPGRNPRDGRRQPVRVHDLGVARSPPRRAREREEEEGQEQHEPRPRAQVVRDPVAVGDPEVTEVERRDDTHLDALPAQVLDGVCDERACEVTRRARVRRRQDADLHA